MRERVGMGWLLNKKREPSPKNQSHLRRARPGNMAAIALLSAATAHVLGANGAHLLGANNAHHLLSRRCPPVSLCDNQPSNEAAAARRESAERYLGMCVAVSLSGDAGLQPFTVPSGWMAYPSPPPVQAFSNDELTQEVESKEGSLRRLLEACEERAPSLFADSSATWSSAPALLPLARLAAWTDEGNWVRPLSEWQGEASVPEAAADIDDEDGASLLPSLVGLFGGRQSDAEDDAKAERREAAIIRSLSSHLLETWDVPDALHGALAFRDGPPLTEAAHRISNAFLQVQVAAGKGDASVLAMLREVVSPTISKAAAKQFVKQLAGSKGDGEEEEAAVEEEGSTTNPLHALRRAQVAALGGADWLGEAACASKLGSSLQRRVSEEGDGDDEKETSRYSTAGPSEAFAQVALEWVVRHEEGLTSKEQAASILNFFVEMNTLESTYTPVGRTPKTVSEALEAYTASTFQFADDGLDEAFQPNPRGIKGLFELGASIPEGTVVRVPYDGKHELGGEGQPGQEVGSIRIAEILSLRRLFYEGEQLINCLEDSRRSQIKYLSRARARVSSFWSLTKQVDRGQVEHLCLIEVWHVRDGNEIRQAEGPRPRTIPSAEAWYWLDKWCKREGVDLSTWDCYS